MKTKITGSKGIDPNNAAIRRKPQRRQAPFLASASTVKPPPPHAPEGISDAAMILARQVTHLGIEAVTGGAMEKGHALRGLMAAMITVSSAVMDRPEVVNWFHSIASELEEEDRAEYAAAVRAALRG
jgi:hypothetical protein